MSASNSSFSRTIRVDIPSRKLLYLHFVGGRNGIDSGHLRNQSTRNELGTSSEGIRGRTSGLQHP